MQRTRTLRTLAIGALLTLAPIASASPCCFFPEEGPSVCQDFDNATDCDSAGGTPAPLAESCATFECDADHACCFGLASTYCTVVPGRICGTAIGGALIDAPDCAGNCGPFVTEYHACCLPNGACVDWPNCPDGTIHPEATSCAEVTCSDLPTVPCVLGGACVESLTIQGCNAAGGYTANAASCATLSTYTGCCLADLSCVSLGLEDCAGVGGVTVRNCLFPCGPSIEHDTRLWWSIDIGGDRAVSDPSPSGDETLDPGKLYRRGQEAVPFDDYVFKYDPTPSPIGPRPAPACAGLSASQLDPYVFDLDAIDHTDRDLTAIITPEAMANPIPRFDDEAIGPARSLLLSYDDDGAANYADSSCSVPPDSLSPAGATHGTGGARDEIVRILLTSSFPPGIVLEAGYLDEAALDSRLGPNPDADQSADDDVDALDLHPYLGFGFMQFSSDHEAPGRFTNAPEFLDPGDVYQLDDENLSPVRIIDGQIHLGLPQGVDLDAIEFAWLPDPTPGRGANAEALALLFSVDDDDPTTPADESGGLDPRTIYFSFLTGTSDVYLGSLADDVDAITILNPVCFADLTGDNRVDVYDFRVFAQSFATPVEPGTLADFNASGSPDVFDFSTFLLDWGCGTGP